MMVHSRTQPISCCVGYTDHCGRVITPHLISTSHTGHIGCVGYIIHCGWVIALFDQYIPHTHIGCVGYIIHCGWVIALFDQYIPHTHIVLCGLY